MKQQVQTPKSPTPKTQQPTINPTLQRVENKTGMPDQMKSNLESMSGFDMSDVRVHRNSSKPAQLQAHAYAQGTDIHLAPGQEKHLGHEAWHVVQQKQGRVKPTMQLKSMNVNDDSGLEREADVMGRKILQRKENIIGKPKRKDTKYSKNTYQLKSEIAYGSLINDCGSFAEAFIDCKSVPKGKSPPKSRPSWWGNFKALSPNIKNLAENYLVQGHLLNHEVGGPDNMLNLTPITKSTNTKMAFTIEKAAKDAVDAGYDIVYRVNADYSSHPTVAELQSNTGIALTSSDESKIAPYLGYFCGWISGTIDAYKHTGDKTKLGPVLAKFTTQNTEWIKNESADYKGVY